MKKIFMLVLLLITAFSLAACGGNSNNETDSTGNENSNADNSSNESADDNKEYKIKIASYFAEDHPQIQAANKFKELVEEKTDGNIAVEVYPNSQLGSEDSYIPAIKNGSVEMGISGTMINTQGAPLIAVTEMPFLFDGWEHANKVFTGEIGKELAEPLIEEAGIRGLGWTVNGFREVSSSFPIKEMDDFKGMKIRVPNVPYYVEMAKGFGANPVTMGLDELFTALEQKAVDGQDNPYPTDLASKFYEVQDYILETRHIFSPNIWIINEEFFQSLPDDYQTAVTESMDEAVDYNWKISEEFDNDAKQKLIDEGIEITVPDEELKQQLRDSQEDVEQWFYDEYEGSKELVEKIRSEK